MIYSLVTIGLYLLFLILYRRRPIVWFLPIFAATVAVLLFVVLLRVDLSAYQAGTAWITWLLGPATIALAVPLYRHWPEVKRQWRPILLGTCTGSLVSLLSVLLFGWFFSLPSPLLRSLVPKSVTSPIAVVIAEALGGYPSVAAAFVVLTGVFGMVVGPAYLKALGVQDVSALGLALGTAAHGAGTARALAENEAAGAMASVAMILSGVSTLFFASLIFS